MNQQKSILLIGGGGHCHACIDVVEQQNHYQIAGIIDSSPHRREVLGYPVLGNDDDLVALRKTYDAALITIGQMANPELRIKIFTKLKELKFELPVIISPLAYVSRHAIVGEGTIVMHHAIINAKASVGVNGIINSKALIEHDASIGDHCHISTAAVINGAAKVADGVFFGSNAVSKQTAQVGKNAFIKAGSLVK